MPKLHPHPDSPPPPQLMPIPAPPAGSAADPPPLVVVDRCVSFVDELQEIIKEKVGVTLDQSIALALKGLQQSCSSSSSRSSSRISRDDERAVVEAETKRYRAEVEEPALAILRHRNKTAAVRKEPLPPFLVNNPFYRELLDGIELLDFSQLAEPPSVSCLSLRISWPHNRHLLQGCYPCSAAFISSSHRYLLVLYVGSYRPGILKPGFYLVYNVRANSVAIAPPLFCFSEMSHRDIGAGVAVLSCGDQEGDYVLAELLLHRVFRSIVPYPTTKATLFIWGSASRRWDQREVVLPLPLVTVDACASDDDDTTAPPANYTSFRADMVFAVSSSSICWVDLLMGILVYNHIGSGEFHFIPLPEEEAGASMPRGEGPPPQDYRSMCCVDRQTLKFVSFGTYKQGCLDSELMLTTWTLTRPLSPRNWKWNKDMVAWIEHLIWDDPVYKRKLKLQPLMPSHPIISTRDPAIIYLSVHDCDDNHNYYSDYNDPYYSDDEDDQQLLQGRGCYTLSVNIDRGRIEYACKVPSCANGTIPHPMKFASDFTSYLNKTSGLELIQCRGHHLYKGLRRKVLADEGDSRSNPSTAYTVGVGLGKLKLSSRGGLGARCVIPTPYTAPGSSSRKTGPWASSCCPGHIGLQAVLDIAID